MWWPGDPDSWKYIRRRAEKKTCATSTQLHLLSPQEWSGGARRRIKYTAPEEHNVRHAGVISAGKEVLTMLGMTR